MSLEVKTQPNRLVPILLKKPNSCCTFQHEWLTVLALCALWPLSFILITPPSWSCQALPSLGQPIQWDKLQAPLITSHFEADQWRCWQELKPRLWTKWGQNKTAFLSDRGLGANNRRVKGSGGWWPGWEQRWRCLTGLREGLGRSLPRCPCWWASWINSWEQGPSSVCRSTELQPCDSGFRSDQARF